ncbi:MAG: hypothetical protein A2137_05605 [Chloroflexi bacterium RBG_16_58_8]|nr:MAG: hypothetical protein A2137_05605 [Chloroflexi bacterium RBG_16_58_8]
MKKTWSVVIVAVAVLAVVGLAGCNPGGGVKLTGDTSGLKISLSSQQEGIWVNGEGKVTAVPDVAILSVGIQAQEASVARAQAEASGAMDRVMKALKDGSVMSKDIQTQNFNIQKVTRWDNNKQQEIVLGYQVTNMVTAKIRDIASAGSVIDAVTAAGGDLTRVNSIGFTVDNPAPYQAQARQKAVADAAARAKQLADTAGIKLGKPTYVTENSYVPGPIYRATMEAAAPAPAPAPTPVSPGEMDITANVQIAYAIAD